jgi:hypothetical protein
MAFLFAFLNNLADIVGSANDTLPLIIDWLVN